MTYALALFDFDGTLADSLSYFTAAYARAAERFDLVRASEAELHALRGLPGREVMQRLGVPLHKLPAIAAFMRGEMARDIGRIALFPGIAEALVELHERGVRLGILSSNSPGNVRAVLGPLQERFTIWEAGASMFGKEARLKRAVKHAKLLPRQVIFVGDELRDLAAARAVGTASGAVLWGYADPARLEAAGPGCVFRTPAELARISHTE